MAQGIDVPGVQNQVVPYQAPNPLPFVSQALDRQQEQQKLFLGQLGNLGDVVNSYHQQKIQNQLAALATVSQLYAAGGPRAVNQYAPSINQATGTQTIPNQSQVPPPSGTPQNATLPISQDPNQSIHIQASQMAGHPDVAGQYAYHAPSVASQTSQQPVTAGVPNVLGQPQSWNAPQPSPEDIQDIESGGIYGRNKAQSFKDLGDLSLQPITAAQKQLDMQKTSGELAMQPTDAELKKQQLVNAQQQIPMEQKKTVAGEVSKESQSTQNITQLKTLTDNLQSALQGHNSGVLGNQSGSLYQMTGGRMGSKTAAAIQNAANPLATALNTELARRFNSGEVALLSQSLIPQPKDTPEYAQQKLQNLNKLIDSMASGNENNVKNVAAAITSGTIPSIGKPSSSTGPHGNKVVQHGHTYNWNPSTKQYE